MNLLLLLISITLISNSVYAMIAPFFPIEAEAKQVPLPIIGLIIGIYSVAVIINSTLVGKIMSSFGRSYVTTLGMIFMGTSMIGFALSHYIEDRNIFVACTLVIRFMQGLASSSIQTSVYSMITIVYPDKMERVIGYIEATMGIALVVGPLFGSVCFYFGGFQAPFLILGAMFFIFVALGRDDIKHLEKAIEIQKDTEAIRDELLGRANPSARSHRPLMDNNPDSPSQSFESRSHAINKSTATVQFAKIPITKLLGYKQFVFAMMSGSLGYFIASFAEPVLAIRLKNTYGFKDSVISLFFVAHFVGYLLFSPLIQFIPKRFEKRIIMIFGSFTAVITLFLYGPSRLLGFPEDWRIMFAGLLLMGCSITFCLIPALPEMIRSVEKDFDNSKGEVNDVASGVFNTALGFGQVSGPLVGSFLTNSIGFRETTDIIAIYALVFGSLYFTFGNGLSALTKIFKSQKQINDDYEEMISSMDPKTLEVEMHSLQMMKAPINDYFNRSLSDQSMSLIKRNWSVELPPLNSKS